MKPILFNTENVRAILEGRKTVTRRVCKPGTVVAIEHEQPIGGQPYYKGDILWVRETWNYGYIETSDREGSSEAWFEELRAPATGYLGALSGYFYKANCDPDLLPPMTWRPSIHMPKEAARIFLRVTDVRVERLQDITIVGPQAEGILPAGYLSQFAIMTSDCFERWKVLWDSTIKLADRDRYGWAANPWVWVISFERISKEEAERDGLADGAGAEPAE